MSATTGPASPITTHILDTSRGRPAAGVPIELRMREPDGKWLTLGSGVTDSDGRLKTLHPGPLSPGIYELVFAIGDTFPDAFYPEARVAFCVRDASAHYHIPLLLSPFGYSTYRGS